MNEYTNVVRGAFGGPAARATAVTSIDDDPEKAARAIQLGEASGESPAVVYGDLENYDKNYRRTLTAGIVEGDEHLSEYANSDPMAAKVSNDDWGQLAKVTKALERMRGGAIEASVRAFKEGFGEEPWGSWIKPEQAEALAEMKPFGKSALVAYQLLGLPLEGAARVFGGLIKGGKEYTRQRLVEFGVDPYEAERATRDLAGMVEYQLNQTPTAKLQQSTGVPRFAEAMGKAAELTRPPMEQLVAQGREAYTMAEPYFRAGKAPPLGLHPLIDDAIKKQSETSLEILDDLQKEAQKSTTRERAPAMFENFVKLRYPDTRIGIAADAVAELYKGKMPHAEDNLLGWVPDLEKQMYTALSTGGDVEVPLAGWLARVDPEVAKQLHDFIRVRPGDLTKTEATEMPKTAPIEEPKSLEGGQVQPIEGQIVEPQAPVEAGLEVAPAPVQVAYVTPAVKSVRAATRLPLDYGTGPKPGWDWVLAKKERVRSYFLTEVGGVAETLEFQPLAVTALNEILKPGRELDVPSRIPLGPIRERLMEVAGDVPVYLITNADFDRLVGKDSGFAAYYNEGFAPTGVKEHIVVPSRSFYRSDIAALVFHEAVHAATFKAIHADPKLEGVLDFIRQDVLKKNPELASAYGMSNADEFLAEALSNKKFQAELSNIRIDEPLANALGMKEWIGKSIWKGIIEFVRRAMRLAAGEFTALEAALRLTETVVAKQEKIGAPATRQARTAQAAEREAKKAIWRNKDTDLPIEVVDEPAQKGPDGRMYQKVIYEGKESFVPADEIVYSKKEKKIKPVMIEREPELSGITRQEDLRIFQTITGWMNKSQYERYMELIAKRNQEDAAFQQARAEKILRRQMTQEWKQETAQVKAEVLVDLDQRPDISGLEYLRSGKLYGEDTGTRPRVNPQFLTDEQKALFPERYLRRDGMHPSDVAQLFGFTSFDEFALRIKALDEAIGNGSLPSYLDKLAVQEAERRMLAKHGNLEENILREAQEHVVSDTQMDLLHEEVVALGMKAGSEMTFTKADFKAWAEEQFKGIPASSVSAEKYLREIGTAGRKVEAALLAEDPKTAFVEKQRQIMAMILAKEAAKFEKEVERFDRLAKRMSQRVVKGMDQAFVDWTQSVLTMANEAGKRSAAELAEAVQRSGFDSLREFVDFHRADGWELSVDEAILSGQIKPRDQMTVQEFRDFKESVDSLTWVGGKIKKITVAGDSVDFDLFKKEVVDNITSLPPRDKAKPVRWIYLLDAELTKMEEIMKDLDLRKELGPLFNAVIRPMAEAKHTEFSMIEKLTKDLKDIKGDFGRKWQRTLNDEIPNDFLTDPFDGALFDISRQQMLNIMLNFGNRSNIEKFTKGYAGKDAAPALEQRLWQMFDEHATKQDWQYVQKIWDLWETWRKEADNLYYDLSGVPPKWIEPAPITNKHGTFAGGYFPIIYDRLRSHLNVIEERQPSKGDKGLFKQDYFRATPGNSYTKERTGYIDVVQFDKPLDMVATRMQQTIHDISFRRQVIEAGKVLYDRDIRAAIRKHYGMEYEKQLDPWLKHTANYFNVDESSLAAVNAWLRRARVTLITHALGFNLKVIFSPATGKTNPLDLMRYMNGDKDVLLKSRELEHTFRNIDRDYREQLESTIKGGRLDQWQAKAMQFGFYPTVKVDQYFRNVTFYNEYQKGIHRGLSEGDAAALADAAVRERHGTGAAVDLPGVLRGNEALKMATIFYGFFNTMYNWQRQIPGQLRRGEFAKAAKTGWGALVVPAIFGAVLFNQRTEDESPFLTWAKALPLQLLQTLPLGREIGSKFIEGQGSRSPWTSFVEAAYSSYIDFRNLMKRKPVPKGIKHTANTIGLAGGLPLGQAGRTGQFAYDVSTGAQRPKNILEWMRGIIHGEAKLKRTRN